MDKFLISSKSLSSRQEERRDINNDCDSSSTMREEPLPKKQKQHRDFNEKQDESNKYYKTVLGPILTQELVDKLKKTPFSIIMDETTDVISDTTDWQHCTQKSLVTPPESRGSMDGCDHLYSGGSHDDLPLDKHIHIYKFWYSLDTTRLNLLFRDRKHSNALCAIGKHLCEPDDARQRPTILDRCLHIGAAHAAGVPSDRFGEAENIRRRLPLARRLSRLRLSGQKVQGVPTARRSRNPSGLPRRNNVIGDGVAPGRGKNS
ncbi:hypothetical protein EVAR_60812_1 [Eumeta japonica]|uniref:DUF4371 domain-containing protein n=1 Tax=Eumeta variegata TaxID=151549 RepID=A0A4C1YMF3_EUMVA|nr:hypothetical protein EVAR_60812_1 [Eumeta japonica]